LIISAIFAGLGPSLQTGPKGGLRRLDFGKISKQGMFPGKMNRGKGYERN